MNALAAIRDNIPAAITTQEGLVSVLTAVADSLDRFAKANNSDAALAFEAGMAYNAVDHASRAGAAESNASAVRQALSRLITPEEMARAITTGVFVPPYARPQDEEQEAALAQGYSGANSSPGSE